MLLGISLINFAGAGERSNQLTACGREASFILSGDGNTPNFKAEVRKPKREPKRTSWDRLNEAKNKAFSDRRRFFLCKISMAPVQRKCKIYRMGRGKWPKGSVRTWLVFCLRC
jgi:hypothetical protein